MCIFEPWSASQDKAESVHAISTAFLTWRRRQSTAEVRSLEGAGWMGMTSLQPAVTQVPLGHPRMACSSRVDEIGRKNADQAQTHTHTHLPYSATKTSCTFLHSGVDNGIEKKRAKVYLKGFRCISFTANITQLLRWHLHLWQWC